jgi:hypothetical protein
MRPAYFAEKSLPFKDYNQKSETIS